MALFLYCMHLLPSHKCKESRFTVLQRRIDRAQTLWVASSSSNNNNKKPGSLSFGERLLDYIEGGPKLRKWYGAPDQLPRDGIVGNKDDSSQEPEQETVPEVRDAVLVTDGDSKTGQLVILSLIVKRARIKALVKDTKAAVSAFGSYIEPVAGDITDNTSVRKALKGVCSIICTEKMGMLTEAENLKGIEHIILLSQLAVFRSGGGIQAFMNEKAKRLAEADEIAVITSGVSYTIVRTGSLQDKPGGQHGFSFKEGCAGKGTLSREDAAAICVEALYSPTKEGLIFEVINGKETVQNWNELFSSLANSGNQE